jgi:hypothetical protein
MMKFVRSLLGMPATSGRKVVGTSISFDAKELDFIKESNRRLTDLFNLHKRYRGSGHEQKIKAVYDKTKQIHTYLIAKKQIHSLELFHLQNTDHFLNAFTAIIEAFQQEHGTLTPPSEAAVPGSLAPEAGSKRVLAPQASTYKAAPDTQRVHSPDPDVPLLRLPMVQLSYNSMAVYSDIPTTNGRITRQIGLTSTRQEKESFLKYIASRLSLSQMQYMGNAYFVSTSSSAKTAFPIIKWNGYTYAIDLTDFRLFPVVIQEG